MKYAEAEKLEPEEFKRSLGETHAEGTSARFHPLCGVNLPTFEQMVKVLAAEKVLAKKTGRPSKLRIEDQVLMTLQYWREYRTYFHLQGDWGLDETNVLRNVKKVENILIRSGMFNVGGKKKIELLEPETDIVVIDVAEHEIERPKKTTKDITVVSRGIIH